MTTFDRREEAFERQYAHDEELQFRAHARRTQKVGLWAATLLGREGADAAAYAEVLVALEVGGGTGDAIVQKIEQDFLAAGVARSTHQIRRQMDDLLIEARREIQLR